MPGTEVLISPKGENIILVPVPANREMLFSALDEFPEDFMATGRLQPDAQTRSLSENALSESPTSLTCPNSSDFSKNNARNISHMPALIFGKFFDFEQVSADSEMSILG